MEKAMFWGPRLHHERCYWWQKTLSHATHVMSCIPTKSFDKLRASLFFTINHFRGHLDDHYFIIFVIRMSQLKRVLCTDHGHLITSASSKASQVLWRDGSLIVFYPIHKTFSFQAGLGTLDHCACYASDLGLVKARFKSITGVIMWCECFTFLCYVLFSNRVYILLGYLFIVYPFASHLLMFFFGLGVFYMVLVVNLFCLCC